MVSLEYGILADRSRLFWTILSCYSYDLSLRFLNPPACLANLVQFSRKLEPNLIFKNNYN